MKTCRRCGEAKPIAEFHRNSASRDGHRASCKQCGVKTAYTTLCSIDGCDRVILGPVYGLCRNHHRNRLVHGEAGRTSPQRKRVGECYLCSEPTEKVFCSSRCATRVRHIEGFYKLPIDKYMNMLESQAGDCAICKKPMEMVCIDHDHNCCPGPRSCGKCVRGLLCNGCNKGIGFLKDSEETLASALGYLKKFARTA